MSSSAALKPALGFLICAVCWGFSFIFINVGVSLEPPLWMDFFWVSLAFLFTWALMRLLGVQARLTPKKRIIGLLLGIPGSVVFIGLLSIAEMSVAPGQSSVLTYTYPIWVLLISVPLLGERLTPQKLGASLLGFLGIALIARVGASGWSANVIPIAELLAGSLGWSITNVAFKKLYGGDEILTANLYQFAGAVLPLGVWALSSEPLAALRWSPQFLWVLLFLASIATAIPTIIWFKLISKHNVATLAAYTFLVPVVSIAVSFLIYGERPDEIQLAGIAAVLASIYAMNRSSSPASKKPDL